MYIKRKLFSIKDEESNKAEKIGKTAATLGGVTYIGTTGAQKVMKGKAVGKSMLKFLKKTSDYLDSEKGHKEGLTVTESELRDKILAAKRAVESKKSYKNLQKAKKLGLATAIAGGALYGGSRLLKNKKED